MPVLQRMKNVWDDMPINNGALVTNLTVTAYNSTVFFL